MNKTTVINIRVEEQTKAAFQQLCSDLGLTMSEVICGFMEDANAKKGLAVGVKKRCRHAK